LRDDFVDLACKTANDTGAQESVSHADELSSLFRGVSIECFQYFSEPCTVVDLNTLNQYSFWAVTT